jgi:hypothetical protein
MLLPLLLSLAPLIGQDPAVVVRIDHDQFQVGDHGRVYVKSARDGYLVILHADPDGRVRVLFPLDPGDDNFVRGGKQQELRSRSDRDALQMDAGGSGTVLAAFSVDTFTFDELTRNGHWDYAALGGPDENVKADPLADLLEIANNMARTNHFDYDVATYVVYGGKYASDDGYDGHGHSHVGVSFGFGYYPFGIGYAYGYPFYSPFGFMPFWGFGYGVPYYPYGPSYGYPVYRAPVIYSGFGAGFTRKGPAPIGRFDPTQARARFGSGDAVSNRDHGFDARPRAVEPRNRSEPRIRNVAPRGRDSRLSVGDSRPSGFTRSFGGISRTFGGVNRSFGGFGGSRGGFTGTRRH